VLRERRPVLVTPDCTLVAGFHAVVDLLRQPRIFTTALYRPKMGDGVYLMCHDDDALHTREKSLMQAVLSRDDLPAVRALVGELARAALDNAVNRRIDAIADYTRRVPARLVQEYFGLKGRDEAAVAATIAQGTPHATVVPPGPNVLALTQSAMFDPAAFDRPDEFIRTRNGYHTFHFGFGPHERLGRYVGMVLIPEMVRQIFLPPGLAAEGPMDYGDGPFPQHWTMHWSDAPTWPCTRRRHAARACGRIRPGKAPPSAAARP
jgi:cytochrome P450